MSDANEPNASRRKVLKATAAATGAAGATATSVGASSGDWQPVAESRIDALGGVETMLSETGVYAPDVEPSADGDMPGGKALLEKLSADGLLETATYANLPSERLAGGSEGVYHVTDGRAVNLGFRVQTSSGKLDIVFQERGSPIAVFTSNDGFRAVYGTQDGETFSRELSQLDSSFGATTTGCSDTCTCYNILCDDTPVSYTLVCENKSGSDCFTTTRCAC